MNLRGVALVSVFGLAACSLYIGPPTPDPVVVRADGMLVFATSKVYQGGGLGGLEGADAICNQHAADAGLGGDFKAWLSEVGTSAASRLSHATRPYLLVDGTRIADNWDDLIHADLENPVDLDEHGDRLAPATDIFDGLGVWTNTRFDGEVTPWTPGGTPTTNPRLDCMGWSSFDAIGLLGIWNRAGAAWTASSSGIGCTEKAHLYCFEQ
jgi:hypothetical protein